MSEHIVKTYDEELSGLRTRLAHMGGLAEEQLAGAMGALNRRDTALAQNIIDSDEKIDELEREIEEKAILVLAKRQPVAGDLREIVVALRLAMDLERIGDFAKNIAKRIFAIAEERPFREFRGLNHIARLALEQLKNVLDAYARKDAEKALSVWHADEELDSLYNSLFRELLTYMMEDPRTIGTCTHLLFGAKNIERIGDHTTNIAEKIYFLVHGEALDARRPKGDTTSVAHVGYVEK